MLQVLESMHGDTAHSEDPFLTADGLIYLFRIYFDLDVQFDSNPVSNEVVRSVHFSSPLLLERQSAEGCQPAGRA